MSIPAPPNPKKVIINARLQTEPPLVESISQPLRAEHRERRHLPPPDKGGGGQEAMRRHAVMSAQSWRKHHLWDGPVQVDMSRHGLSLLQTVSVSTENPPFQLLSLKKRMKVDFCQFQDEQQQEKQSKTMSYRVHGSEKRVQNAGLLEILVKYAENFKIFTAVNTGCYGKLDKVV